jgi:methylmalonyl-CoA mutase
MSALDFKEFAHNGDYDAWKKLVMKELGDKPYETLIWQNENGFEVEPNYPEMKQVADVRRPASWEACQEIAGDDAKELNTRLLQSLMGGSNAIGIDFDIPNAAALEAVMKDIEWPYISVHFRKVSNPMQLLAWVISYAQARHIDTKMLRGSLSFDGLKLSSEQFLAVGQAWKEHFALLRVFEINAEGIHNKGGNTRQELTYALASGNELMHRMREAGITVDDAAAMIQFRFATGGAYFPEIAKYRAFRLMWRTIVSQYNPEHACSLETFVYASTSTFLQTNLDIHNNLLRGVTQSMSAILGGANAVQVAAHESAAEKISDSSLRLARNIQQLLTEESHIDKVGDVAYGSHYIEKLTELITQHTWASFQDIESKGGITRWYATLLKEVESTLSRTQSQLTSGKKVVVGVNKYKQKIASTEHIAGHTLTGFLEKE